MKPSELIRQGCALIPQQDFEEYWPALEYDKAEGGEPPCQACVMGTLYIAVYPQLTSEQREQGITHTLMSLVDTDDDPMYPCPACTSKGTAMAYGEAGLFSLCVHLNDHHRWTREQIAAHLESLGH